MGATALAFIGALLVVALVLLLIPTCVLLLQVLTARQPVQIAAPDDAGRARLAVLMPAHNEAAGIELAIQSVLVQMQARDRLFVIADNCTDDTAVVAVAAGAEVVVRQDLQRRGKGYALDFGVRCLHSDPPEVVVVVDADCSLGLECLSHLSKTCIQVQRPVQAMYLMRSPRGAGLKTRMAELAWVVRNQVRPLGYLRLNLPCQLMGSGMAFPWRLICNAPLASGHIVEDMQLGLDLASEGTPPVFCPQATVGSSFPVDAIGLATQRTRWEHGHLGVIAGHGLGLLWKALSTGRLQLLAMAFDLCVPPLAVLALLLTVSLLAALVLLGCGGTVLPLLLAATALTLFTLGILRAWHSFGRHIVSRTELLSVPAYMLAKLPMYARLLKGRQAEWVRTRRDDGTR